MFFNPYDMFPVNFTDEIDLIRDWYHSIFNFHLFHLNKLQTLVTANIYRGNNYKVIAGNYATGLNRCVYVTRKKRYRLKS